ncbi:MAG: hypothetical protein ABIO57_03645 [Candidatus Paceibacterota bacterium]
MKKGIIILVGPSTEFKTALVTCLTQQLTDYAGIVQTTEVAGITNSLASNMIFVIDKDEFTYAGDIAFSVYLDCTVVEMKDRNKHTMVLLFDPGTTDFQKTVETIADRIFERYHIWRCSEEE